VVAVAVQVSLLAQAVVLAVAAQVAQAVVSLALLEQ
jgi:hypothetical protein